MTNKKKKGISYADSGVDIEKADNLIENISASVRETYTDGVIGGLGGFGGLFAPDFHKYEQPVLVAGTDGVGTKLKLAHQMSKHDTIGIDLVAMCVNDILAQGAKPLFFLDYLACGSLDLEVNEAIIRGVVEGCKQAGTALIGGETAEMPGFYPQGEYDVAGFAVGIAERAKLIDGSSIKEGDQLLGFASSGVHSNGFSLVRYLLDNIATLQLKQQMETSDNTLADELLKPTRIYVKQVLPLLEKYRIKGIAHITGGGLLENIPRVLPDNLQARIVTSSWPDLEVFNVLKKAGQIEKKEMYRTFNMGIGLVLVVEAAQADAVKKELASQGENMYLIGEIVAGDKKVVLEK